MAKNFIKLRCKMRNLNGEEVSDTEYILYSGDTFNVVVPVVDESTGEEGDVVIAVLSLVDGVGAMKDNSDLDSFLEEIIPDDDKWDIDDNAKA